MLHCIGTSADIILTSTSASVESSALHNKAFVYEYAAAACGASGFDSNNSQLYAVPIEAGDGSVEGGSNKNAGSVLLVAAWRIPDLGSKDEDGKHEPT